MYKQTLFAVLIQNAFSLPRRTAHVEFLNDKGEWCYCTCWTNKGSVEEAKLSHQNLIYLGSSFTVRYDGGTPQKLDKEGHFFLNDQLNKELKIWD